MTRIVATPLPVRLRKAWLVAHRWIALVLMILLIPLGLSGVVLAWDDAIDQGLNPQRYAVSGPVRLGPAAYADAARAAGGPGTRIASLRYPGDGGPVTANILSARAGKSHGKAGGGAGGGGAGAGTGARAGAKTGAGPQGAPVRTTVWLDPATGRALDVRRGDSGLVRIAHTFHGSLFLPGVGRALIGLLGVAMFLLAASGIWLWWPPLSRLRSAFRWRRGDRRLDTNLHHMIGFWISVPLAFQAFTGAWIASPQMIALFGGGGPAGAARMRPQPVETPALSPDVVLASALAVQPGSAAAIAWPMGADGAWRVTLTTPNGAVDVTVPDTGAAASIAPVRGGALAMAMRHLHDGTTLGAGWRVALVLIGLAPTALGVTGLLMWLRNRRWRKRRPKARRAVAA